MRFFFLKLDLFVSRRWLCGGGFSFVCGWSAARVCRVQACRFRARVRCLFSYLCPPLLSSRKEHLDLYQAITSTHVFVRVSFSFFLGTRGGVGWCGPAEDRFPGLEPDIDASLQSRELLGPLGRRLRMYLPVASNCARRGTIAGRQGERTLAAREDSVSGVSGGWRGAIRPF